MTTIKDLVRMEVSKSRVRLRPDASHQFEAENDAQERAFEVDVINTSDRFASFQLELLSDGMVSTTDAKWYTVEPEVCAKKPPGARTTFRVLLTQSPLPTYDTSLPLKIRVSSVEFDQLVAESDIRLVVDRPIETLKIHFPFETLKVTPGEHTDIPVVLHNLSPKYMNIRLQLCDLAPDWFNDGVRKEIRLDSGDTTTEVFRCTPPKDPKVTSAQYSFTVEADVQDGSGAAVSAEAALEVLPKGTIEFTCPNHYQTLPKAKSKPGQRAAIAYYDLNLDNLSNLAQRVDFTITDPDRPKSSPTPPNAIAIEPGATAVVTWLVQKSRPLLGLVRKHIFEVELNLSNANSGLPTESIYPHPSSHTLELKVKPIVPMWLQLLALGSLSILGLGIWTLLNNRYHEAPVNSVRIIHDGNTVVSGSSDQSLRQWDSIIGKNYLYPLQSILPNKLIYKGTIAKKAKLKQAVSVIRERPGRTGEIAVGLESGEIRIWKISPETKEFTIEKSQGENRDRVFSLSFAGRDYLFSGHGSGFVRRWKKNQSSSNYTFDGKHPVSEAAISAMTVLDTNPPLLLTGGQFNDFFLVNWDTGKPHRVNYSADNAKTQIYGKHDYITSIVSDKMNSRVIVSDNRGYISIWNAKEFYKCLRNKQRSQAETLCNQNTDFRMRGWKANDNGQSIRAIAVSEDGCYLTSVGDSGNVIVWFIDPAHDQEPSKAQPKLEVISDFAGTALKTVDMRVEGKRLLVASDAPDNKVSLRSIKLKDSGEGSKQCLISDKAKAIGEL